MLNNYNKRRYFIYTIYHKRIKIHYLNEIYKYDDSNLVFIETEQFGTSNLFITFTIAEIKSLVKVLSIIKTDCSYNERYSAVFCRSGMDSPIEIGLNAIKVPIDFSSISIENFIDFIAFERLVDGSNIWYEKNMMDINNQCYIMLDDKSFQLSVIDFIKFLGWNEDDKPRQSISFLKNNESSNSKFDEIYYYLPELDLYQKLSIKKYQRLNLIDSLVVNYSLFDTPQCFSEVHKISEYYSSGISDILCSAVCIVSDFYYSEILEVHERSNDFNRIGERFLCDGFHFELVLKDAVINVDITAYELGLRSHDGLFVKEQFSLLQLIDRIVKLKM